ncbi:MAG: hypothetical protein KTR20_05885 [Cellvibrionaceae bacterium]|nr:hypothetical protein [Cellvibrionaceae bacterium]
MFNRSKNTVSYPYAVTFPNPTVSLLREEADQKHQQYGAVFHVVKTANGAFALFSDYELHCKASQILALVYSSSTGFEFTCAA